MNSDHEERIDEIASDLEDLQTTVEEIQAEQTMTRSVTLRRLKTALDQARDATDELDDQHD